MSNTKQTTDSLPPHSTEAEQGVLGCVLLSEPHDAQAILAKLTSEDFYDLKNRELFETLLRLPGKAAVSAELGMALIAANRLNAIGGSEYLDTIQNATPTALNIDFYIDIVKDCAARRNLIQHCKDQIDWAMDRSRDMALLPEAKPQSCSTITTRAWVDLHEMPVSDPSVLIGPGRWATRGSGTLLVSCTGAGKSTIASTLAHAFALGRPCLGFVPNGPLKSVVIQAEDDDGDLAEMSAGIRYALNPNEQEMDMLRQRVRVCSESSLTSLTFLRNVVRPILRHDKPDLLWINPLNSYIGADVKDQEKVALFFRNTLNPMLYEAGCHAFVIHHTPKPTKDNKGYSALDMAYSGSGSADLANWAREVVVLQQRATGLFEMVCVKRGSRLGWKDADGNSSRSQLISYGESGKQYWRLAEDKDLERAGAKRYSEAAALELVPITGIDKAVLVEAVADAFSVSERSARDYVKELARAKMRQFEDGRYRAAFIKETKRPRGDVYPGESGRAVVWVTKLSHFERKTAA